MESWLIAILIGAPLASGVGGYYLRRFVITKQGKSLEAKSQKIIDAANDESKEIVLEAKDEAIEIKEKAEEDVEEKEKYLQDLERDIRRKEEVLDRKGLALEDERKGLADKIKQVEDFKEVLKEAKKEQLKTLEKISKVSQEEAKKILLNLVEKETKEDLAKRIKELEHESEEKIQAEARNLIASAIQRLASDQTAESTVATVHLPSEEMKGRIIGREGRNIQAFEKELGVDLIIDDTPEAVVISCFDPIRREVARIALAGLVKDGRIHPTRIEEMIKKAKNEVAAELRKAGEAAAFEVGIADLHPDVIKILGRLKYRTSYGQNVLKHSIEVAHISGMIADELGADTKVAKKAGLLHDLGKAVDHEVGGSHAVISRDIAKKYGVSDDVLHAIEAHHEEVEKKTCEAAIVAAADAISSARPGARRETLETYIKRLEELEEVANTFEGVEKSYAIQAGREVRVIVIPEEIDDAGATTLARDIARKIEKDLDYPGQIKVNVIREVRATDFAK
jgi:ribonuclease Y